MQENKSGSKLPMLPDWGNDHQFGHLYDYGDPTIRYLPSDGYFYIVPSTPLRAGRSAPIPPGPYPCCYVQWVARSRDLMTWEDGAYQDAEPFMGWPGPHRGGCKNSKNAVHAKIFVKCTQKRRYLGHPKRHHHGHPITTPPLDIP